MQAKLNDHFEFPRTLDLWPYSVYGRAEAAAAATAAQAALNKPGTEGETATTRTVKPADTSSGLPADADHASFIFELAGIVIHMGTAVGGHYYSYIRERAAGGVLTDRWMEFNDASVLPWEASDANLESDCFGGVEVYRSGGVTYTTWVNGVAQKMTTQSYTTERVRSASAFCLIYDRAPRERALEILRPTSIARRVPPPSQSSGHGSFGIVSHRENTHGYDAGGAPVRFEIAGNPVLRAIFGDYVRALHGGSSDHARLSARSPVPSALLSEIRQENLEFWKQRTVCEDAYVSFVENLVTAAAPPPAPGLVTDLPLAVPYPWGGVCDWVTAAELGGPAMPAIRLAIAFILNTFAEKVRWIVSLEMGLHSALRAHFHCQL